MAIQGVRKVKSAQEKKHASLDSSGKGGEGPFKGGEDSREIIGMDPRIGGDGHEIGIVRPAGHQVHMKVGGQSGPGTGSYIDADVQTLGTERFPEGAGHQVDGFPKIGRLVGRKFKELGDRAVREDHEMARIVGKSVEDRKTGLAPVEDKIIFVIAGPRNFGKNIGIRFLLSCNITVAPGSPKMFHQGN